MGLARPRLVVLLTCLAAIALAGAPAEALAAKKPTAKSTLAALVKQTNRLPAGAASAAKRRALKRLARHARRVARRRPCASVRDLARFRRVLGRVKVKKNKRSRAARRLTALGPASLDASRLLLAGRKTRRCGGGVKPGTRANPRFRIVGSNARRLRVRVQLPQLHFVARQARGKAWTELKLSKSDAPGNPGTPGIPFVSDFLAVPDGAKVSLKTNDVDKLVIDGVDVFPVQKDPVDQATEKPNFDAGRFADGPFEFNRAAYAKDRPIPAKPADSDSLGQMRDLNLAALQIPAAQYNPDSKKLTILKSVDVTLTFRGGPHTFSDRLSDPFEQGQRRLLAALLNANAIKIRPTRFFPYHCGEEMMVITNPATLAAATTLSNARNAAGIRTRIFQTGAGAGQIGTTAAEIQAAIRAQLVPRLFCIRPSYVTIMGDDDLVPTFPGINGIPSDLEYSMKDNTDELPDLAVGRIIGNDLAAVQTAVNKIVSYENSPPSGLWLRRATVAAQFQDDDNNGQENRTFIQFAETVRKGIPFGNAVDRVYGEHPGDNPQKFNDGTDLPAALKKPTFAWNGSGADVTAAWNEGRFMMVHRDHGYSDGWGTPGYGTAQVQALTNGAMLPVMLSINCSSGAYDYDETSFVGEALVNPNGGVAGAFGDTRDSPTWHNTQIAWGFADALIPSILPSEGPATRQRVGDALIHGKLRLAGLAPPAGDGSTRNELYLWHYFGDPTMQMWGGKPLLVLDPNQFRAEFVREVGPPPPDPPPYWVVVNVATQFNGQTFSIYRNGQVLGKAIAADGKVEIPATLADGSAPPGQLEVALEADGSPPIRIPVQNEPARGATSINGVCSGGSGTNDPMFMQGTLAGAPAGSVVSVTYHHQSGVTHVEQATTNAQGGYQTSYVGNLSGDWDITARYAGTDQYAPSESEPCVINSG
jgi:Peptidase family C25/Propeptide_C25